MKEIFVVQETEQQKKILKHIMLSGKRNMMIQ